MLYRRNRYVDPATGRFTQEDPIGLAGGLNLYGYANGDPVNFSDPFGLWPEWLDRFNERAAANQARQFAETEQKFGWKPGQMQAMHKAAMLGIGGTGGVSRTAATLARRTTQLMENLKRVDEGHLDAVRRELGGADTGFDHVTEVRNAMNGFRNVIRSMSGMLRDPNLTDEARQMAESLRSQAVEALEKGKGRVPKMNLTPGDIAFWRDPDELFEALAKVENAQRAELEEAVVGLLAHPDADVRREATRLAFVTWKNAEHRRHLLEIAKRDPNPEVRATAMFGIAATSSRGTTASDSSLLAGRIADHREDREVRRAAYEALLIVHRRPRFPDDREDFDPARDVDWAWVEELRRRG